MAPARKGHKPSSTGYNGRQQSILVIEESDGESVYGGVYAQRPGVIRSKHSEHKINRETDAKAGRAPSRGNEPRHRTATYEISDTPLTPTKQRPFSTSRPKPKQPRKLAPTRRSTTMTDSSIVDDSAGGQESLLDESDFDLRPSKVRHRTPIPSSTTTSVSATESAQEMDLAAWLALNRKYLEKFGLQVLPKDDISNKLKRKWSQVSSTHTSDKSREEIELSLIPYDEPTRSRSPSILFISSNPAQPVASSSRLLHSSPSAMSVDRTPQRTASSSLLSSPTASRSSVTLRDVEIPSVSTLIQDPEWRQLREHYLASLALGRGKSKGKGKSKEEDEDTIRRRHGLRHVKELSDGNLHHWDRGYYDDEIPDEFLDDVEDYLDNPPEEEYLGRGEGDTDADDDSDTGWIPVSNPYLTNSDTEQKPGTSSKPKKRRMNTYTAVKGPPRPRIEYRDDDEDDSDESSSEFESLHQGSKRKIKVRVDWGADEPTFLRSGPLRPLVPENSELYKGGKARWCHMCHKKKIIMNCCSPYGGCNKSYCDACLARYPLPFDARSTTFECPVCQDNCICLACRRKRAQRRGKKGKWKADGSPKKPKQPKRVTEDADGGGSEDDGEGEGGVDDASSAPVTLVNESPATAVVEEVVQPLPPKQAETTSSPRSSPRTSEEPKSSDPGGGELDVPVEVVSSNGDPSTTPPAQPISEIVTVQPPLYQPLPPDDLVSNFPYLNDSVDDIIDTSAFVTSPSQPRIGPEDDLPKWPFSAYGTTTTLTTSPVISPTLKKHDSLVDVVTEEPFDYYEHEQPVLLGDEQPLVPPGTAGIRPDALMLINPPMMDWEAAGDMTSDGMMYQFPRDGYSEPNGWTPSTIRTDDQPSIPSVLSSPVHVPQDAKSGGPRLARDVVERGINAALGSLWVEDSNTLVVRKL